MFFHLLFGLVVINCQEHLAQSTLELKQTVEMYILCDEFHLAKGSNKFYYHPGWQLQLDYYS